MGEQILPIPGSDDEKRMIAYREGQCDPGVHIECEIRLCNCAANGPCVFCGERTDPQVPIAIFKRGTYESVCDVCSSKYAPEAAKVLELFYDSYRVDHGMKKENGMETNRDDDVLKSAYQNYVQHNFDMDEAEDRRNAEKKRVENWHKCIAWAIDELDIASLSKMQLLSKAVLNLESTLARMNSVVSNDPEALPF
jgi:hypothetical protein